MTTWEYGRESDLLDDIIAGRKTYEGRLKKGKFAKYTPGDIIKLRRDVRSPDGILHDGEPDAARVRIVAVHEYPEFLAMVRALGYKKVIPSVHSAEEAADEYDKYYSAEDQNRFGVLAIKVVVINGVY